jgi:hypothetical protein
MTPAARLSLVDRADGELSLAAQCRMLKVARSTLYWRPAAASKDDLRLMRLIDEQYLTAPFYGSRQMVAVLRRDGCTVSNDGQSLDAQVHQRATRGVFSISSKPRKESSGPPAKLSA